MARSAAAGMSATTAGQPPRSRFEVGNVRRERVLIAGGVSVGKFDLVPAILEELGVAVHFRQVRMKPGKPLLFGTKGDTLVFGLPGNPVSAFVCFELFVRPALRVLAGHADPGPVTTIASARGRHRGDERPADVSPREARTRRRGLFGAAAAVVRRARTSAACNQPTRSWRSRPATRASPPGSWLLLCCSRLTAETAEARREEQNDEAVLRFHSVFSAVGLCGLCGESSSGRTPDASRVPAGGRCPACSCGRRSSRSISARSVSSRSCRGCRSCAPMCRGGGATRRVPRRVRLQRAGDATGSASRTR